MKFNEAVSSSRRKSRKVSNTNLLDLYHQPETQTKTGKHPRENLSGTNQTNQTKDEHLHVCEALRYEHTERGTRQNVNKNKTKLFLLRVLVFFTRSVRLVLVDGKVHLGFWWFLPRCLNTFVLSFVFFLAFWLFGFLEICFGILTLSLSFSLSFLFFVFVSTSLGSLYCS